MWYRVRIVIWAADYYLAGEGVDQQIGKAKHRPKRKQSEPASEEDDDEQNVHTNQLYPKADGKVNEQNASEKLR